MDDYGLKGQLARIVQCAIEDTDRVSMLTLGGTAKASELSIVVIKGHQEIEAFRQWAERQGLYKRSKDSGMGAVFTKEGQS